MRNRFAKDVGFNYKRDNYNSSREDPRFHKRDRYDNRRIEYQRSGSERLTWDEHKSAYDGYNEKSRRYFDEQEFGEDSKKRARFYRENGNSNSNQLGELLKFSKSNKHYSSRIANDPRLKHHGSSHTDQNERGFQQYGRSQDNDFDGHFNN